jgi:hypothetical protein
MILDNLASIATILGGVAILFGAAGWIIKRYIQETIAGVKRVDEKTATLERNGGSSLADKVDRLLQKVELNTIKVEQVDEKISRHLEWHLRNGGGRR